MLVVPWPLTSLAYTLSVLPTEAGNVNDILLDVSILGFIADPTHYDDDGDDDDDDDTDSSDSNDSSDVSDGSDGSNDNNYDDDDGSSSNDSGT